MPAMPAGDPWPPSTLGKIEEKIRLADGPVLEADVSQLDVYWVDIIRLLQIFKFWKLKDFGAIAELRRSVTSAAYHSYIDSKLQKG